MIDANPAVQLKVITDPLSGRGCNHFLASQRLARSPK